jgi:hypothetical protein
MSCSGVNLEPRYRRNNRVSPLYGTYKPQGTQVSYKSMAEHLICTKSPARAMLVEAEKIFSLVEGPNLVHLGGDYHQMPFGLPVENIGVRKYLNMP